LIACISFLMIMFCFKRMVFKMCGLATISKFQIIFTNVGIIRISGQFLGNSGLDLNKYFRFLLNALVKQESLA